MSAAVEFFARCHRLLGDLPAAKRAIDALTASDERAPPLREMSAHCAQLGDLTGVEFLAAACAEPFEQCAVLLGAALPLLARRRTPREQ